MITKSVVIRRRSGSEVSATRGLSVTGSSIHPDEIFSPSANKTDTLEFHGNYKE